MLSAIVTIVSDPMESEGGLFLEEGSKKFHHVFTFRFWNYFLGANVSPEINSLCETVNKSFKNFSKNSNGFFRFLLMTILKLTGICPHRHKGPETRHEVFDPQPLKYLQCPALTTPFGRGTPPSQHLIHS